MISVLILTKNEEQDLPNCINSVRWCDDVHVFDSFSDDRTVEIAKNLGAKVMQRKFDGYASQRNAALELLHYKYPWILILDADERIPHSLVPVLRQRVRFATDKVNGFRIRRRDYLGRTWLKYSQLSPFFIRLIRKGKARYHREINEVLEVEGGVEDISGYFEHLPFSKGLVHWIKKHNEYSSMEAKRWLEEQSGALKFSMKVALFSKDFNERRYHQKGLFYKLPGRPVIKWFYMMFCRKAFLDGKAGFTYATLQAIYEYFIVLKVEEKLNYQKQKNDQTHFLKIGSGKKENF